jgi:hypothetical protein
MMPAGLNKSAGKKGVAAGTSAASSGSAANSDSEEDMELGDEDGEASQDGKNAAGNNFCSASPSLEAGEAGNDAGLPNGDDRRSQKSGHGTPNDGEGHTPGITNFASGFQQSIVYLIPNRLIAHFR